MARTDGRVQSTTVRGRCRWVACLALVLFGALWPASVSAVMPLHGLMVDEKTGQCMLYYPGDGFDVVFQLPDGDWKTLWEVVPSESACEKAVRAIERGDTQLSKSMVREKSACDTVRHAEMTLRSVEADVCYAFGYNRGRCDGASTSPRGGGCAACTVSPSIEPELGLLAALVAAVAAFLRRRRRHEKARPFARPRTPRWLIGLIGLCLCGACGQPAGRCAPPKAILVRSHGDACEHRPGDRGVDLLEKSGEAWASAAITVPWSGEFSAVVFRPRRLGIEDAGTPQRPLDEGPKSFVDIRVERVWEASHGGAPTFEGPQKAVFELSLILWDESRNITQTRKWRMPSAARTIEQRVSLSAKRDALRGTLVVAENGIGFSLLDETGVPRLVARPPTKALRPASTDIADGGEQAESIDAGKNRDGGVKATEVVHAENLAIECGGPSDLKLEILAEVGAPKGQIRQSVRP
jgi:MYXO-CTERM domain-containing protein